MDWRLARQGSDLPGGWGERGPGDSVVPELELTEGADRLKNNFSK